ncbi:MAG TPA: crosslink repair DNA glycosylase YcaQ family protein [Mycobacteriales bacterium]|nr:crosslink repair DNA glycosylase YcaQ family protein [Mycobacteriales bacterium]
MPERLSTSQARRVALAAQGFADPAPTGPVTRRHVHRVLSRTHLLQIDSVNVFERAHHVPLFSRLGPYDTGLVADLAYRRRELFEYWGHEASLLPVGLHPLLRWRMARAEALEEGWGGPLRVMRERPEFVAQVLERVREEGPLGAGALREGPRRGGSWWSWDDAKIALEYLFWAGRVSTSSRRSFERLYDLTERVVPADVLALPAPSREDAQRALVLLAARAHGVATERDLRDYFRLRVDEGAAAVRLLVEEGALLRVEVEGWQQPAYLHPAARVPRRVAASALLSPFDPLVWERARTSRLFGFDYRIEIYVPAAKRVHGYYVLPFLHREHLAARVDLKSDRAAGVLRVPAAWLEPGQDPADVAAALAAELRRAADWQGLSDIVVEPRGDLSAALAAAVLAA